ncbi:MAG: hypothetical protein Q7U77_00890 [Sediminibacterium sp.]|uniref:hypothetical protein n=1 Tax=Sediminibacterium sp. TaxID=1917865 RepID=UPI002715FED8|nr:hypothetical protein [Sediminibacterium sp.]MDO8995162.1 hypothetical protein [Sediminibacterium sp.]
MKIPLIVVSILIFSVSCKTRTNDVDTSKNYLYLETRVVNDIFLMALDTPYYPYDDFLLHDLKTLQVKNESNLIAVSNKLEPIKNLDFRFTLSSKDFDQSDMSDKKDIYNFIKTDSAIHGLNLDSLTNIGRFKIVRDYDFSQKVNHGILGSIKFSRIAFSQQFTKGYLVITTKDKVKSSVERWVFVELVEGRWRIRKSIIISVS